MSNLREINTICKEKLDGLAPYELIEKVLGDKETIQKIGNTLNTEFCSWSEWEKVYDIKETITIFLVGCAKYFYNDRQGGFWEAVKSMSGIKDNNKPFILKAFNTTLSLLSLEKFEEEKVEGYTQMGTILAHAGLSEGLENALVKNIANLRYYDIAFEKLGEECIDNSLYAPKSMLSYLNIMNKLGTLNDFVYDVLQLLTSNETSIDDSLSIPESLQQRIIDFKSTTTVPPIGPRYNKPSLHYDIDSNFVYIEIPDLINETSSRLKVIVKNGEDTIQKNLYENGFEKGKYVFRSSIVKIEPEKNIEVFLYDELDNKIWNYQLKKEGEYILFNNKGEVERTNSLSGKGGYILIDDGYVGSDTDQDLLIAFENVNLYVQQETEKEVLIFNGSNGEICKIQVKKPVEIIGGERLFGENCKFQGIDAYYILPDIKVPFSGEWSITITINEKKQSYNLVIEDKIIKIDELIKDNDYGKVNIRLFNKFVGYKSFRLLYLPYVEKDISGYLPGPEGFRKARVAFKYDNSSIIIYDKDLKVTNVIECKEDEEKINGIFSLNDCNYDFSIMIRPYSWRLENNDEVLYQPNTKGYLSLKDITKFGDCILTFRNNTDEKVYIKIDNGVDDPKFLKVNSNSRRVLSVKEYFEFISKSDVESLLYVEQDYKKICEICSFRINLAVRNIKLNSFSNDYDFIAWDEDGLQKNRELRCRYVHKPYEYFIQKIEDGQTILAIDRNNPDYSANFVAEIALKREGNLFDIEDNEKIDLLDSTNSVVVNLFEDIPPFTDFDMKNKEDYEHCLYSYLTYRFNRKIIGNDEVYKKILSRLLRKIITARILYGDEKLIKTIFKYNLDKKQFNLLVNDFRMYLPITSNQPMSSRLYRELERFNPYLYVVYSLVKVDHEQIDRILVDNCSYFDRFVDKDNFIFARKYQLFNDIETVDVLKDKFLYASKKVTREREEKIYLMALIDFVVNESSNYKQQDEGLIIKLSRYIKNIFEKYPRTLIQEFFTQTSRRK